MTEGRPWRVQHYGAGYCAEYQRCGMGHWRIVKDEEKKVRVFSDRREARAAAEQAYLDSLDTNIRSTLPFDASRMERKMAEARDNYLRSNREDQRQSEVVYKAGRPKLTVMRGRA